MTSILARMRVDANRYKAHEHHQERELDLIMCLPRPTVDNDDFDGSGGGVPTLDLIRCEPTPRVVAKDLTAIAPTDSGKAVSAIVKRYEVCEVSRLRYTETMLRSALYFLIIPRGVDINPALIPGDTYVKWTMKGTLALEEEQWKFMIEQIK